MISTVAKGAAAVVLIGLLASLFVIPIVMRLNSAGASQSPQLTSGAAEQPASEPTGAGAPADVLGIGSLVTDVKCIGTASADDRVTPTTKNVVIASSEAVLGTIQAVDGPRWNTPDGAAAPDDAATPFSVYRTVTVSVDKAIKGDAGATVTFRVPGGKVGCAIFAPAGIPLDLPTGQTYLFFSQDLPAADAAGARLATVTDVWPVVNGVVTTPEDGKLSIDEVVAVAATQ